jgi:serine/threonine-protein kinase RsbW
MVQQKREYSSDLAQLPQMRVFVREVCQSVWSAETDAIALDELELAVQESACNIITHAYQGEAGQPIELVVQADAEEIWVTLHHGGVDFDPAAVPPPAFDGSREGGFGLYLIKNLVDEVQFLRRAGEQHGTCLHKRRKRNGTR